MAPALSDLPPLGGSRWGLPLLLTVVVAGAVAVIAIGRVVVAAIAGPVALLVAVALVPVVPVALIPTLTLTCGGSRAQGPMDHLAHAGARMEEILPFGWRGYYGSSGRSQEATVLVERALGPSLAIQEVTSLGE